ncbi:hypothetical protein COE51_01480 [Bacillus pseudomycoides]|nr:hypothetical protein COE51_01480 [Bacillus pseudomycoides]
MALDKDRIKEELTPSDIKLILKDLGSKESKKDMNDNLIFSTICHHGSSQKLYYYHETKMFHCYTECSCSFDVYSLVVKSKGLTFPQAVQYVAGLTGKHYTRDSKITHEEHNLIDDWDWLNKFKKKEKINTELPLYDEKVLDVMLKLPHETWIDDNISVETMKEFEIGYYIREEKISIVHRDINSRFIGLRGRALKQEDIENGKKYMPMMIGNKLYNHMTMMNLYGLHKTKYAVQKLKKIMFFEGEKSVLKCQDFYGDFNFTCAVCSSNVSNFHRDIALSLGVEEVFIAFDKFRAKKEDESEEIYQEKVLEYQERLIKFAHKFTPYCRVYVLWDDQNLLDFKESPADKGKEVLEKLMQNKYEITTVHEVI